MRSRNQTHLMDINNDITTYLNKVGYPFIDDVIAEIGGIEKENNPIFAEFDAFNPESTSCQQRNNQLGKLTELYGNERIDHMKTTQI